MSLLSGKSSTSVMSEHDVKAAKKTALLLTGGGARAAYQVGVLSAIADLLPNAPDIHLIFD